MATEILVKVYIDGAGDYTSLRAAVIAEATNLVSADSYIVFELKGDLRNTDSFVDFNSYTTDATRNVIIRPVATDRTTGVAGATGTIYGVNTFAIVARDKHITIDGLEFDGWTSQFFAPANVKITNCLMHNGDSNIQGIASVLNTIIYDVANQSLINVSGDVTNVTAVNKISYSRSVSFLIRGITGVVSSCAAYNDAASTNNYSSATNAANDLNASNDATAIGTTTYSIATTDFVDYANNNFNIDTASSLYSNSVGADLRPVSSGISIPIVMNHLRNQGIN